MPAKPRATPCSGNSTEVIFQYTAERCITSQELDGLTRDMEIADVERELGTGANAEQVLGYDAGPTLTYPDAAEQADFWFWFSRTHHAASRPGPIRLSLVSHVREGEKDGVVVWPPDLAGLDVDSAYERLRSRTQEPRQLD